VTAARALLIAALLAPVAARGGVRPAYGGTIRIALELRDAEPALATTQAELLAVRATAAPLLELDAAGALRPGLLAEVPLPEAGGRAFRLRLRPGLRRAGGAAIGAGDVAAAFVRLLGRGPAASPQAWVALPVLGADALLDGRAAVLAGVQVLSDTELLVTLAFPLPDFPWLLATPALAIPGAGPFAPVTPRAPGAPALLRANEHHHRGRPYADALELHDADARGAARLLEAGRVDLVLRPEAAGGAPGPALPMLLATVAAVNGARLGPAAGAVRAALGALDRAELARRFVRGPAEPLASLVPGAARAGASPVADEPRPAAAGAAPARLALLVSGDAPDQRAIAERIQVKLFDRGVHATVEAADPARFAARLSAGDFDVALVPVAALAPRPALAAAAIAFAARGAPAARRVLAELGAASPDAVLAAADRLGRELGLVPLVAAGARVSAGPRLAGLAVGADGGVDPGDLWLSQGGGR
jgi:peptide/nickel transport system substrate-binding protein